MHDRTRFPASQIDHQHAASVFVWQFAFDRQVVPLMPPVGFMPFDRDSLPWYGHFCFILVK
jgi:hypothetical protein